VMAPMPDCHPLGKARVNGKVPTMSFRITELAGWQYTVPLGAGAGGNGSV